MALRGLSAFTSNGHLTTLSIILIGVGAGILCCAVGFGIAYCACRRTPCWKSGPNVANTQPAVAPVAPPPPSRDRKSVLLSRQIASSGAIAQEFTVMNPMTAAKRVTTDGSARASVVTAPSTTAPSAQQQRQDLRAKRGVYNSEAFPAVHIRKGEEEEDELDLHGHPTQAWEQRSDDSDEVPSRAGNVEPFVEPDDGPEPPLTLVIPPSSSTLEKHRSARSRLATSSTQSLSDQLSTSLPRQNSVSVSPQRKSAFSRYVTSTPLSNGSPRIASTSASIGNHMESPSQLPPSDDEWVLSTDTVSGCEYYYNRVTGKSSWYHPGRPLWKRCVDTSTGQPYWFNVATRESSWTEPIQDNAQQGTPLSRKQSTKALDSSSAWTCVYTDKGVPYYWNSETGQSSWTNPTGSQA